MADHIARLKQKLQTKRIDTGPTYEFIPKVHDHADLASWFCQCLHALGSADADALYVLCNAMRKSIWDTVQDAASSQDNKDMFDRLDPDIQPLVKEMTNLMKFRVVSYQRMLDRVTTYTRNAIAQARAIAKRILHKQDDLSTHIQTQAQRLRHHYLSHLPMAINYHTQTQNENEEEEGPVEAATFVQAFQVRQDPSNPRHKLLLALKQRAKQAYADLAQLRINRVHAVLAHDKVQVQAIDAKMKKLATTTRALTGARQHLASQLSNNNDMFVLGGGDADHDESATQALTRLSKSMTKKKVLDFDLYKANVEHVIEEHATGLALFLGITTQAEIAQLQADLQTTVCTHATALLNDAATEVQLLNQEMASMHTQLLTLNKGGLDYLEHMAKVYRANIARLCIHLLGLFDKR